MDPDVSTDGADVVRTNRQNTHATKMGSSAMIEGIDPTWFHKHKNVRRLGYGTFGVCWVVRNIDNGEEKVVRQSFVGNKSAEERMSIAAEAEQLMSLNHPNILFCSETFSSRQFIVMITELCEGGDLFQLVKRVKAENKLIEPLQITEWLVQLTDALRYIHSHKMIHGDVKTNNAFLTRGIVKLGSFKAARNSTVSGTPVYLSEPIWHVPPEVLTGSCYAAPSDIWSLGCILYELCTLAHPFHADSIVKSIERICDFDVPSLDHQFGALGLVLKQILVRDPEKRPSAIEILRLRDLKDAKENLFARANAAEKADVSSECSRNSSEDDENSCYDTASDDEAAPESQPHKEIEVSSSALQAEVILQDAAYQVKHGKDREAASNEQKWNDFNDHVDIGNDDASVIMNKVLYNQTAPLRYHQAQPSSWFASCFPTVYFTGRQSELRTLYSAFFVNLMDDANSTSIRYGISQDRSVGKTQLMLQYAWSNRSSYPGGVYMLEADSDMSLRHSVVAVVEAVAREKQSGLERKAKHEDLADELYKALSKRQEWLLCVDAVDTVEVQTILTSIYFSKDRDFAHGHLLFASRSTDSTLWANLGVPEPLRLASLEKRASAELLYLYAKGKFDATSAEVESDIEALDHVEQDALFWLADDDKDSLQGIPLALEQAGSFMRRTSSSFANYRELYTSRISSSQHCNDENSNVCEAVTWEMNVEGLTASAFDLLMTCSRLRLVRIPESILRNLVKGQLQEKGEPLDASFMEDRFQSLISELVSQFSVLQMIVRKVEDENSELLREYTMYGFVRRFLLKNEPTLCDKSGKRALEGLNSLIKDYTYGSIAAANRDTRSEIEKILSAVSSLMEANSCTPQLSSAYHRSNGYLAQFLCQYDEAIKSYEAALQTFEEANIAHGDSIEYALLLNQLGNVLTSKGDHKLALARCEEALEMLSRLIDSQEHPHIATVIHRIATIHDHIGNWDVALDWYNKSLAMKNSLYGQSDHPEIASTLYRIGNVLESKKDYQGALIRYIDSLNMKRNIYKDNEPRADVAYALFSIGSILHHQSALDKALEKFNEVLKMRRAIYGKNANHVSIAKTLEKKGYVLFDKGNLDEAKKNFAAALAMQIVIHGPDHNDICVLRKSIEDCDQAMSLKGLW